MPVGLRRGRQEKKHRVKEREGGGGLCVTQHRDYFLWREGGRRKVGEQRESERVRVRCVLGVCEQQ